jgi:hypothetical protein
MQRDLFSNNLIMKKPALLLLLLLTSFVAISQESGIIDDTPVGLVISVIGRGLRSITCFIRL